MCLFLELCSSFRDTEAYVEECVCIDRVDYSWTPSLDLYFRHLTTPCSQPLYTTFYLPLKKRTYADLSPRSLELQWRLESISADSLVCSGAKRVFCGIAVDLMLLNHWSRPGFSHCLCSRLHAEFWSVSGNPLRARVELDVNAFWSDSEVEDWGTAWEQHRCSCWVRCPWQDVGDWKVLKCLLQDWLPHSKPEPSSQ